MPRPRTCSLRRTKPVGPMNLYSDLRCYEACVELTDKEKGQEMDGIGDEE